MLLLYIRWRNTQAHTQITKYNDAEEQSSFWESDNYQVQTYFDLYKERSIFIMYIRVGYWDLACARVIQATS
jgi:hypothetical protein